MKKLSVKVQDMNRNVETKFDALKTMIDDLHT